MRKMALTKDTIFDVLSNSRRCHVLQYLSEKGEVVHLHDMASAVATREANGSGDETSEKRVYISLYQLHLPKLADEGIIEYDPDQQVVELDSTADRLLSYLCFDPENDQNISTDEIFNLLSNSRRRHVVQYLVEFDGLSQLDELTEYVAAKESGLTVSNLEWAQRRRVSVSLNYTHLPKLEQSGVIEFDVEHEVVELQPIAAVVNEYIQFDSGPSHWKFLSNKTKQVLTWF